MQPIENYYKDLISHGWELEQMLSLVKYIQSSGLNERLFGHIYFLEKLVVAFYNPGEWRREALHIEFNRNNKRWYFEYFAKPHQPSEVERCYDPIDGINKSVSLSNG